MIEKSKKTRDDYIWSAYHNVWETIYNEPREYEYLVNNFHLENGELIIDDNIHENAKDIYTSIYRLKPKSVFEAGCGPGYHLRNIKLTSPEIDVAGCDINKEQIALGKRLFSIPTTLSHRLYIHDLVASPFPGEYEFIFSHAVSMHLSWDRAALYLKNIASMSTRYVLLIESNVMHNYDELIAICFPEYVSGLQDGIGQYCEHHNSIWFLEKK